MKVRAVNFDVISKIEDAEVGFSVEEGNFPSPPDDLIGKPWPLAFGTVCDIPMLQARSPRQGILKAGTGIHDFTLPNRICQAKYLLCPAEPKGTQNVYDPDNPSADDVGFVESQRTGASDDCACDRCIEIANLEAAYTQQLSYETPTITIIGGEKFPQGVLITLDINGGKFTGTFAGDVFTIVDRKHPEFDEIELIACRKIGERTFVKGVGCSGNWERTDDGTGNPGTGNSFQPPKLDCLPEIDAVDSWMDDGGAAASQKALDEMPTSSFFWAQSGSKVLMDGEEEIIYIANLLPSTINRVSAFRSFPTGDVLTTVPDTLYDIYQTNYGGYTVTELVFPKLLSLVDPKWRDDVYVSLTSSEGPNTAEILQWLIEKYTTFAVDATSFNAVATKLTNYPSNFAFLERKNIVEVLREIAYQARCAIYIRDNTVFLKYLSDEPTSVATITEDDIENQSLQIYHTDTEDLVTKTTATWRSNGAQEDDFKIILRHNVKFYGTQEEEYDYYIYNIREHVLKSATFWMIRNANTWRKVRFRTPIKHLAIEIFDCITLNLSDLSPSPVKAIVEKASFDSATRTIEFECWTPLRAGTTTPYFWAWPAGKTANTPFPTAEEIERGAAGSGGGDGYLMVPPDGHILGATSTPNDPDPRADFGDPMPSDLDDVLINAECPLGPDVQLEEEDPSFLAFKRAARAGYQATKNAENAGVPGGGGGNDQPKKDKDICGNGGTAGSCRFGVNVYYGTVTGVWNPLPSGSGCGKVFGYTFTSKFCHTFGSEFMARYFLQQKIDEINAFLAFNCVGADGPTLANLAGSSGSDCPESSTDPSDPSNEEIGRADVSDEL